MPVIPQKRLRLTWAEKVAIINKTSRSPSMSYNNIAQWAVEEFSLPSVSSKTAICTTLLSKMELLHRPVEKATRKNVQRRSHTVLDQNVVDFVMLAEADGVSLSAEMIVEHARRLVTKLAIPEDQCPRLGLSWLRCLQGRYSLKWRRAFGESDSAQVDVAEDDLKRLKCIISAYPLQDVFNMDESAFFYNAVPRGPICKNAAPALKQCKARVTIAVCSNADGSEKLPILYVGTAAKPRWLSQKPVTLHYIGTEKGWMTGWLYQQWLVGLDEAMRTQNCSIYFW